MRGYAHSGDEMSQPVYLCLVTGRIFFYLSPPTSNLNNIILMLFYFHFLKLTWGCTIINNKQIESSGIFLSTYFLSLLRPLVWPISIYYSPGFDHNPMAGSGLKLFTVTLLRATCMRSLSDSSLSLHLPSDLTLFIRLKPRSTQEVK